MKTYTWPITQESRRFCLSLWLFVFCLLPAMAVKAAPEDIDLSCSPVPPLHTIDATVGESLNVDIGVLGASGDVFWDFAAAPTCAGGPASYTCNGVTIALPAGSPGSAVPNTDRVTVAGTPGAGGAFNFRLVVTSDNGLSSCERDYELIIAAPYDVVFVLDRSGSMNSTTHIIPPATDRWDALKHGVNGFTPFFDAGSRFGLTLFATDVLANNSFPAGLVTIDANLPNNVETELNSQTPSGWTAMGSGLKDGMGKLTDASRPRVVVLFTDGEQNQPPEINIDGCTFSDGTNVNPTCPAETGSIKIVTVGIGDPSGDYHTTLQNLAVQNRGNYIVTSNGQDFRWSDGTSLGGITEAFDMVIAPTLTGTSPQLVTSYSGTLSGTTTLPAFKVNRQVGRLLLKVSFSRKFEIPQLASLLAGLRVIKDGTDVTEFFQPVIVGNFTNAAVLKTNFTHPDREFTATLDPQGSYAIQLTEGPVIEAALGYRVVVFADDHRLDIDWQASPAAPRVNQPFEPTLRLSWLGTPVTDADVEAWILKPGDDLGDLLAKNPQKVDPATTPDAGSPGHQKFIHLLKNDPEFLAQLKPNEQQLTLTHQGDGAYSTAYDPGDVSGIYQILYRVNAQDPAFGEVQRLAVQSVYARFGTVDLEASSLDAVVQDNTVTVDFRPVTTDGRFVGPAQGAAFAVKGDGIDLSSLTDHQDGSYTLVLTGNPSAPITVALLGEEIYRGPAWGFGGERGIIGKIQDWLQSLGLPGWLVWVVIALILLLLLWLVVRLIKGRS